MTPLDFAARLLAALALGAAIGVERQWRQRSAGLRTNVLVALGAASFVTIGRLLEVGGGTVQLASYVISGVGFLAGGVIFKERQNVSGLNTAATIWCTAAVGVLCGAGFVGEAAIAALLIVATHLVLRPIVRSINTRPLGETEVLTSYELRATCREEVEERIRGAMIDAARAARLRLTAVYSDDVEGRPLVDVVADVTVAGDAEPRLERIISRLGVEPSVVAVSWKAVPTDEDERALVLDEVAD